MYKNTIIHMTLLLCLIACSSTQDKPKKLSTTEKKAQIYYESGTAKLMSKEYTKALNHLLKSNKLNPNSAKTLQNLAMAYYFKGEKDLATRYTTKALELDPKNSGVRLNLASLYIETQKLQAAETELNKVMADLTFEDQFRTYFNLGIIYSRQGKFKTALAYYKKSIKANNNYCPAFFEMGQIYSRYKQYRKALKNYTEAGLGTCYQEVAPIYYQGLMYKRLKEYDNAYKKFKDITERFSRSNYSDMADVHLKELRERVSYNTLNGRNNYQVSDPKPIDYNGKRRQDKIQTIKSGRLKTPKTK